MDKLHILIYCSDNGLGCTSRAINIATQISENVENCSMLLLTDLPIIGRFKFPQNLDYVHLPGIMQDSDENFQARSLNIALKNTLTIRRKITKSAIKTFKPHIIIIEGNPSALPDEMENTFGFVKERLPGTRVIWGLPDMIGAPRLIADEWKQKGIHAMLDRICDEIWVHGVQEIFDLTTEYNFPETLARKTIYTGYIRAHYVDRRRIDKDEAKMKLKRPYVLVTTGSGTDGYTLIDTYLKLLENTGDEFPFNSVIVTGPLMETYQKYLLMERAENLPNVIFHRYCKHLLQYLKYAELVISNGGFNQLCEILSYRKRSILVPTSAMNNEHHYRAHIFNEIGLAETILPHMLSQKTLGEKIQKILPQRNGFHFNFDTIAQDGLEKIVERIRVLKANPALKFHHTNGVAITQ